MIILYSLVAAVALCLIFLVLWLKERRNSQNENIAYGLRASEDNTENTRTNLTVMESGFREAMSKLEDMGEVSCNQWGQWVWTKSGKPVGDILKNQN